MPSLTKLALAVALVVGAIVGPATPASATTPVEVTAGTEITSLYPLIDLPLMEGPGPTPCPPKPSALRFTTTANPDRWTLSGTFSAQYQFPTASGSWYQVDRTILPGSGGTWAGSAPTQTLTGVIGIQTRIYLLTRAGGPLTCSKTNVNCIINAAFTLAATSTYKGATGLPTTTTGESATVDATSGTAAVSSCAPPWNAIGGLPIQLAGLQLTVQ